MMVSISKELCHPVVGCEVKENQCLLSPSTAQKTMTIGRNYKQKILKQPWHWSHVNKLGSSENIGGKPLFGWVELELALQRIKTNTVT